jgi:Protein of unknown function (DUF3730)
LAETREIWRNIIFDEKIVHEVLSMRRTSTVSACLLFNSMILEILAPKPNISSLLLLIVSTKKLVSLSQDPTESFEAIFKHCHEIEKEVNASNIVLFLLAEILQITSILHIVKLLEIIDDLVVKKQLGHEVIRNMILDGLIQVLAYPSFAKGKLSAVERIMNFIRNEKTATVGETENFTSSVLKMSPELENARDVSIMLEKNDVKLSKDLTTGEKFFWTRNYVVLRGFLHGDFPNFPIETLIEISKSNDAMKSSLVMPLLFKLSSTSNPRTKLSILHNMIQLGATTEIFSTIKALSTSLIRSMSIDLHLRLWKIEPRTYPFLHKALVEKSAKDAGDYRLDIVRASAIREICDLRPQHGSDLVSIISEILNGSEGEIQVALAIDSIVLLCQNHVINIGSTWKALSLTTRYEKRPTVIKSLCKFFAMIPSLKRINLEYENLAKEILGRLWHMIQWGEKEFALEALKSWNYEMMTLDTIPEAYRDGIALPTAPEGMEVSILDMEVPGECFVQLLMKVPAALDLLTHYIGCEIMEFRSGHYLVKEGQPEPINYKNLPKQSILKALAQFVIRQATTKKSENLVGEEVLIAALKILGKRFTRPLPPLNWCFLFDLLHKSEEIKVECLNIAAKQSMISGTAKRLIENFLVNLNGNDVDDVNIALDTLPDLCNGISSEVLRTSIEHIFKLHPGEFQEKIVNLLKEETHVTNRENLATVIATYISFATVSADIIKLIPTKILDAISHQLSPPQKLEFRCEILKTNSKVENPIAWINELIATADTNFIPVFTSLLISSDIFPKKAFVLDFITMIQNRMVEEDLSTEKLKFFIDIFTIATVISSGYFIVLCNVEEIFSMRFLVFPKSIELVSRQSHYNDAMGRIFEFLCHVVESERVDAETKDCFKNSIIISKEHEYFKKGKVWQRCLMYT